MSDIYNIYIDILNKLKMHVKSEPFALHGVVIGAMGTGKTTFAKSLASTFAEVNGGECIYSDSIDVLKQLNPSEKPLAVVIDDVSYQLFGLTKDVRQMLTRIFKIRHTIKQNTLLIFVVHYAKSISPFVRTAPLKVLTSISPAEISAYASEFDFADLVDYLEDYSLYKQKYIYYISIYGYGFKYDVTNCIVADRCKQWKRKKSN